MSPTKKWHLGLVLFAFVAFASSSVRANNVDLAQLNEIALAIKAVKPRLSIRKYREYSLAIYQAATKYEVSAELLVAITQQETSFRPNLPEGRAGELGITQILKRWLRNPRFRREFPNASRSRMRMPVYSFQYAAWLLSQLKTENRKSRTLPYWCFYNARSFKARLVYFKHVSKHLRRIERSKRLRALRRQKRTVAATRSAKASKRSTRVLPARNIRRVNSKQLPAKVEQKKLNLKGTFALR